ncbi:MAG: sterol desaturase family protein [Bacteroidota bacterium]|nr:sterol desaturase family protein [Bacteroidota bacterium]
MNHLQQLVSSYGSSLQLIVFIAIFIVSWNIEDVAGVLYNYKKWKHALINAPFSIVNIPGQLLLGFVFVKTIGWTGQHQFGLLYFFRTGNNSVASFVMIFIFLDLGEYIYHVIMHRVKRLWLFHAVHHSDHIVDVSTTFREHPCEYIIRLSFTLLWVLLSGCTFWMLMIRQIIQAVTTLFAHINYRLPDKADKVIGWIFITPNLHQVHHHHKQPYTDSNYGDVLSVWDRIFGTFKRSSAEDLVFGIDIFMDAGRSNSFIKLLKLPFGKYAKPKV